MCLYVFLGVYFSGAKRDRRNCSAVERVVSDVGGSDGGDGSPVLGAWWFK
jgi:hypothetical protein